MESIDLWRQTSNMALYVSAQYHVDRHPILTARRVSDPVCLLV